jgi:hypothetical protein
LPHTAPPRLAPHPPSEEPLLHDKLPSHSGLAAVDELARICGLALGPGAIDTPGNDFFQALILSRTTLDAAAGRLAAALQQLCDGAEPAGVLAGVWGQDPQSAARLRFEDLRTLTMSGLRALPIAIKVRGAPPRYLGRPGSRRGPAACGFAPLPPATTPRRLQPAPSSRLPPDRPVPLAPSPKPPPRCPRRRRSWSTPARRRSSTGAATSRLAPARWAGCTTRCAPRTR